MLIIQGKLVDEALFQARFLCDLNACQGACCWEGEYGAPLDEPELHILESIYDDIAPYLTDEGREKLETEKFTYYPDMTCYGTPLIEGGACAYLTYNQLGIAQCGIEKAWSDGATDFRKPISCHLYPIRIQYDEKTGFERLVYDRWDICSAACAKGKKAELPLYQFAREALLRKYGEAFLNEMEAFDQYLTNKEI